MRRRRGSGNMRPMHVERFAPSPTGRLHLGHAYSALVGADAARAAGGRWLVRIEDLDQGRARPEFEAAIFEDLAWLGLDWPRPVMRQSERSAAYGAALQRLAALGLVYRCRCTRRDIQAAIDAPQEGGPDGPVYPGTCRDADVPADEPAALRLDMAKAVALAGRLRFREIGAGPGGETGSIAVDPDILIQACGDVVLARKDAPAAYHLAVVLDDAAQSVTHVTRGEDLFAATPIHRLLQALLDLPAPVWRHHRLIRDEAGRRLAKRAGDVALAALREGGAGPEDVRRMVGL